MGTSQQTGPPQIVKLNKAFKLAEQWVNNMTVIAEEKPTEEAEGRPSRLGLGAKVSRQPGNGPSNDPLDRKLLAKLDAGKRKAARNTEDSSHICDDDDDDNEDLESRTAMFHKKRAVVPVAVSLQAKKRKK